MIAMYLIPSGIEMLAEKIKNLRIKLNLSQERFGKKIGVSGKTVSAYERGTCVPPLKVLEKVSAVYGATFVASHEDATTLQHKLHTLKQLVAELEQHFV